MAVNLPSCKEVPPPTFVHIVETQWTFHGNGQVHMGHTAQVHTGHTGGREPSTSLHVLWMGRETHTRSQATCKSGCAAAAWRIKLARTRLLGRACPGRNLSGVIGRSATQAPRRSAPRERCPRASAATCVATGLTGCAGQAAEFSTCGAWRKKSCGQFPTSPEASADACPTTETARQRPRVIARGHDSPRRVVPLLAGPNPGG